MRRTRGKLGNLGTGKSIQWCNQLSIPSSKLFDISRYVIYVDKYITMRLMIAEPPFSTCLYIFIYYVTRKSHYISFCLFLPTLRESAILEKHCSLTLAFLKRLYVSTDTIFVHFLLPYSNHVHLLYYRLRELSRVYVSLYVFCHVDIFG